MRRKLALAVLAFLLVPSAAFLPASGTAILTFGNPIAGPGSGAGQRQLVRLERVGAILRGKPSAGQLAMVTLRTRQPARASSLVLWERQGDDGSSLIQLSVPSALAANIVGATLFFPTSDATARVAHSQGGRWVDLEPVGISGSAAPANAPAQPALLAYPVSTLGFFVRSRPDRSGARTYPRPDPHGFDASTRLARAGWHLAWPVALLVALMALSKRYHGRGAS